MHHVWKKLIAAVAIMVTVLILGTGALLWLTSAQRPPAISIDLLCYTNRVGPHAILAITNRSASAIILDPQCLVAYTATRGIEPRRPISFDGNKTKITGLAPNTGFVQEVFVFPANKGEWQFECYAAYNSAWLNIRSSIEKRFGQLVRFFGFRFKSKSWHKIATDWRDCPP